MNHTATDLVGRSLGPYNLERLIGQGGCAWVFAARDASGSPVAVKVLQPRYAGDPRFEARFRNESETAARLEHPHIVRIRRVLRDQDHSLYAMDLCVDSLAARIAREGPLSEPEAVRVATEIARALEFAHGRGVIHRDLKPDNVLLRADGSAVLSDFGIARAVSGYVASTGVDMTIGTPQYLAPEQAQGRPLDGRADLYGLGITLYQAASGELPFMSTDWFELARMHVEEPPPPLRRRRPGLSKRFERIVHTCLAKHPDDRYQNAAELLADLDAVGKRPSDPSEVQTMSTPTPPSNPRPWLRIASLAVVLALVVIAILILSQ